MSDSLWSLFEKEQPWVNSSCRSLKKSDHERIALLALYKRATVSKLLSSYCTYYSYVFDSFSLHASPLFKPKSESLKLLFAPPVILKEQQEQFALVTLYKRVTMIALVAPYKRATLYKSLPSLISKEQPWAIRSLGSLQKSNGSNSLFFVSESLFCSQKRLIC